MTAKVRPPLALAVYGGKMKGKSEDSAIEAIVKTPPLGKRRSSGLNRAVYGSGISALN